LMAHVVLEFSEEHRARLNALAKRELRAVSKQARLCFEVGLAVLEDARSTEESALAKTVKSDESETMRWLVSETVRLMEQRPHSEVGGEISFCSSCNAPMALGGTHDCSDENEYKVRSEPISEATREALRQAVADASRRVLARRPITPTGPLED